MLMAAGAAVTIPHTGGLMSVGYNDGYSMGQQQNGPMALGMQQAAGGEPAQQWVNVPQHFMGGPYHHQQQQQQQLSPPGPHTTGYVGGHAVYSGMQPQGGAAAVGWGGQAILDTRQNNKDHQRSSYRGRGGHMHINGNRQNQANPRRWNDETNYGRSSGRHWDERQAIEEVIQIYRRAGNQGNGNQARGCLAPTPPLVFQALQAFDGRRLAALAKEMAKLGMAPRAAQLFDELQNSTSSLARLCDTYSYTALVSVCTSQHDVQRAQLLVEEMKHRGVERSVHTYTALMNVCIKCGKGHMALEAYSMMILDGLHPNVITYNTLVDVYGKMGQWEKALGVLQVMRESGVQPVLRTYNTLMIACNICSQPREALALFYRMTKDGFSPNATTYNTLITAHGKIGQLDKAMDVFREMVTKGYPRSVVTYSTLISACERVGQWRRALELFDEMRPDHCAPNTVTYNSLIKACAQGGQWEKALEFFETMGGEGCRPDVVTFTALINACDKGGQWQTALAMFERMRTSGCKPDAIVYNAVIDCLWETGVIAAQCNALELFHRAQHDGHFRQHGLEALERSDRQLQRLEVNLHAQTAGVAMVGLYSWLLNLRQHLHTPGAPPLPVTLAVITDNGRGAREMANNVIKGAVANIFPAWGAPFRSLSGSPSSSLLETTGVAAAEWLMSPAFSSLLPVFFPCVCYLPSSDSGPAKSDVMEPRCRQAFAAVKRFEQAHALSLSAMSAQYLECRHELVAFAEALGSQLQLPQEAVHDALLLMDRFASTGATLTQDSMYLVMCACVKVSNNRASEGEMLVSSSALESASGLPVAALEEAENDLRSALREDTTAISALRCIHVYLERMGCDFKDPSSVEAMATLPSRVASEGIKGTSFLNCRPSIVAAGILYTCRRSRGVVPYWPSVLSKLTGYKDMSSPEMSVAIKAAQRLYVKTVAPPAPRRSCSSGSIQLQRRDSEGSLFGSSPPCDGGSPLWGSSTPLFGGSPSSSFSLGSHVPVLDAASAAAAYLNPSAGPYYPESLPEYDYASTGGSPPWLSSPRSTSSFTGSLGDLNFAGLNMGGC